MENKSDTRVDESNSREVEEKPENVEEEFTPKLFSEEHSLENNETKKDLNNYNDEEQLFDQENNEDEDFEIPAFLRRQKF